MKKIAIVASLVAATVGASPASAAAPTLRPHVWSTKISGSPAALLNATWRLAIQNASFNLARNRSITVAGTVKIVGNRVTFHDLAGPLACRGAQINGSYTWRIQGTKLTFTRVSDACVGRRGVLSHAFTRIA